MIWATGYSALSISQCPNCEIGKLARHEFWTAQPVYYLAGSLLPFALVAITARLLMKASSGDAER
jgi:hypothetical protein